MTLFGIYMKKREHQDLFLDFYYFIETWNYLSFRKQEANY